MNTWLRPDSGSANGNRVDPARRACCAALAMGSAGIGLLFAFWPGPGAALWPVPLSPLHARCLGAMHMALALELASARRELDPAAARIPLASCVAWALALVVAMFPLRAVPLAWVWLAVATLVGATTMLFLWQGRGGQARAERPDGLWLVVSALALVLGTALLLVPGAVAAVWPWKMTAPQAAVYAPPFLAFALAASLSATERRSYVRRPALHLALGLGLGLLAASLLHLQSFDSTGPSAWFWFAGLGALALFAAWRLRPGFRA